MISLHTLPKLKGQNKPAKRVGRGRGSGKGKTSSRGMKGQKARGQVTLNRTQLIKKLPFLKGGLERRAIWRVRNQAVNISFCNQFEKDAQVSKQSLYDAGLVNNIKDPIKILGGGTLEKPLSFSAELRFSQSAKHAIEVAGGSIVLG